MVKVRSIAQVSLQRLLFFGLGISALLLLSALLLAIHTIHHIDEHTRTFSEDQALSKSAIDEIENRQAELNARWTQLAKKSDVIRREEIVDQLVESRRQMSNALESAYERAELLRESIYEEGHGFLRFTVWLFVACVALSLLCAFWTVRASTSLFQKLAQQSNELTRMQYQFLETQEHVARRFSHELHDELGQALTAVKANLSALRREAPDTRRVDDCLNLVDQAIKDVREMSQLLRPTILDDFGLDAALRSLTENFAQRTGLKVEYRCDLEGRRLAEEAETHLFRIAQEALTNVARHSEASEVRVELLANGNGAQLRIADNGHGFPLDAPRTSPGLGFAGMETRARGCGGTLTVTSSPGKGVRIEVTCPSPSSA